MPNMPSFTDNPFIVLLVALLNALFAFVAAFHLVNLDENQRTVTIGLCLALFAVGAYLYAWLKQQKILRLMDNQHAAQLQTQYLDHEIEVEKLKMATESNVAANAAAAKR